MEQLLGVQKQQRPRLASSSKSMACGFTTSIEAKVRR
jgi:hypothetical protein